MGDHRAAVPRSRRSTWVRVLLALTAVFLAVVVVLKIVVDRNEPRPSAGPSPSPTPSASPSPTRAPSAAPSADLPPLEPAPARRIVIDDVVDTGFDTVVSPIGGRLSPLSRDQVARWGERGLPGNPANDTVVVVGSTRDDTASLWGLEQVGPGARITLTTNNGLVSYTVKSVRTLSSTTGTATALMREPVPGRLILVGARYDASGERTASDLVLVAFLSGVDPS